MAAAPPVLTPEEEAATQTDPMSGAVIRPQQSPVIQTPAPPFLAEGFPGPVTDQPLGKPPRSPVTQDPRIEMVRPAAKQTEPAAKQTTSAQDPRIEMVKPAAKASVPSTTTQDPRIEMVKPAEQPPQPPQPAQPEPPQPQPQPQPPATTYPVIAEDQPDTQAQISQLVQQGKTPGEAQALVAGQQPKTLKGTTPAPKLGPPGQPPPAAEQQPAAAAKGTAQGTSVTATEFGYVDNPAFGGYTEPNWNKGAWGDDIASKDILGISLPDSVTKAYFGDPKKAHNAPVLVQANGKSVIAHILDRGPREGGAGADLMYATARALGIPYNSSGHVTYKILGPGEEGKITNLTGDGGDKGTRPTAGPPSGGPPVPQPVWSLPSGASAGAPSQSPQPKTPSFEGGGTPSQAPQGGGGGSTFLPLPSFGGGDQAGGKQTAVAPVPAPAAEAESPVSSLMRLANMYGGPPAGEQPMKPANVLGVTTVGGPPPAPGLPSGAQAQLGAPTKALPAPPAAPTPDPLVIKGLMKRGFTREQAIAFAAKATVSKPGAPAQLPPSKPAQTTAKAPPPPAPSATLGTGIISQAQRLPQAKQPPPPPPSQHQPPAQFEAASHNMRPLGYRAAVRLTNGEVFSGSEHAHALDNAAEKGSIRVNDKTTQYGFVDKKNNFISMEDADRLLEKNWYKERGLTPPQQPTEQPSPQPTPFGPPKGSTFGIPNPPGSEAITKWPRLVDQAKQHAAILSPDDPRVKKQKDNMIKGEHFVGGDPFHEQLLGGLPYGKQGRQGQILAQAEQAIGEKQPLHISYISAPAEAALHPTRESRTIQYEEHSPEARLMGTTEGQLVGHSMIPVSVGISPSRKSGEPHQGYIQGISTNVLANNFQHVVKKLAEMGQKSPYEKLGAKFTNDLEGYLSNLNAGHVGTGQGHAVGTAEYPNAPDENHVPYHLTRREADFLNTVINNTAAFAKHEDGQALRRLAEANGTLITPEGETNRMRHEIEQHEPGWRSKVLEPSIRTFKTGLIHEVHPSEEHMPATIRPGKEYQDLTKAIQRTSERGRPDVGLATSPRSQPIAGLRRDLAHNAKINEIERQFSEDKITEEQARRHLHAIGENPDEYRFVGGSGGLITPYEEDPEAITHEEHASMKDNLRKQWVGGKLNVEDYRRKVAEVPLPSKPSQRTFPASQESSETPQTSAPAPKPVPQAPKPKPAPKAPQPPEEPQEAPEKSATEKLYRGMATGGQGHYYSPDKEWARQFTQSGQDHEIQERHIKSDDIHEPDEPVEANDTEGVDKAISNAKAAGKKAVRLSEGKEQPDSVHVFDKSALIHPSKVAALAAKPKPPAPDEPLPTEKPKAAKAPAKPAEEEEAKGPPPAPGEPLPIAKPGKKEKVKTPEQIEEEKKEEDRRQAAIDRDDISEQERAQMARLNKVGKNWVKQNPDVHDLSMHAHLTGKRTFPGKLKNEQIGEYYDANNPKLDYENEAHREHVSDAVVHDVMHSLAGTTTGGKPSTAYGWYDRTVRKSLKKTGEIAPKILTDPLHEMAWKLALAITSQGQDVYPNGESSWHAYRHWIQNGGKEGGLPESREIFGGGLKAEQMEENFKKVNALWKELGTEKFKQLLMKRMTVGDLKKKFPGLDVPGELAHHKVNGAMFMGPKIGAFFSNLYGDYEPTTMDLWFSRNMNLMAGNMFKFSDEAARVDRMEKGKLVKSHLSQLKDALNSGLTSVDEDQAKKMSAELSALMAHPQGKLDRPTALALAPTIYDWAKKQHRVYQRSYGSGAAEEQKGSYHPDFKTPENLTAKKLDEATGKLADAPRNGTEREWWRDIMGRAHNKLKAAKVHLTNADKQALLWFNIKDLFRMAGSPQRDKADYLDAAHTLVRKVKEGALPGLPTEQLEKLKKAA